MSLSRPWQVLSFLIFVNFVEIVSGQSNSSCAVRWVPQSQVKSEAELAQAGKDVGVHLYICRVNYSGGVIPGKQYGNERRIYFAFKGQELTKLDHYELLLFPRGLLSWVEVANASNLPLNMFVAGADPEPESEKPLYICRSWHNALHLVLGNLRIDPVSVCKYSWDGKEWPTERYDVLVDNRLGSGQSGGTAANCNCTANIGAFGKLGYCLLGIFLTFVGFISISATFFWRKGRWPWEQFGKM